MSITYKDAIDAERLERIKSLCNTNPTPLAIYCQHTGSRIGELNDHSIWQLIQAIDPDNKLDDSVLLAELKECCMLSMKPSPAWTIQNAKRLHNLIKHDPYGACVYFITKAYHQNNESLLSRNSDAFNGILNHKWECKTSLGEWNWERVRFADFIRQKINAENAHKLASILLELDALVGIKTVQTPTHFIENITDGERFNDIIKYYSNLTAKERERQAKLSKVYEGSTLSRATFQHTRALQKPKLSPQVKRRVQKKALQDSMTMLFKQMAGATTQTEAKELRENDGIPILTPEQNELAHKAAEQRLKKLSLKPKQNFAPKGVRIKFTLKK